IGWSPGHLRAPGPVAALLPRAKAGTRRSLQLRRTAVAEFDPSAVSSRFGSHHVELGDSALPTPEAPASKIAVPGAP
ncbi:MAG: hypothetical protein LC721_01335, partial [Actinobacteria bacterium]|nr:hypothetical protein [Actinomycetota bacterium]